jgi:peptidoglycan/LPS O-acetylase OafA/YrhL
MTQDVARATPKLEPLTSLRFFAAAAIVVHHAAGHFGVPLEEELRPFVLDQAVSFFFVLSGFILAYVYPALPTRADRVRFWRARFARLWPAHAFAFALSLLLIGELPEFLRGLTALLNLAMVHAWVPAEASFFSFNAPSWSISTEFGFYVLFVFWVQRFASTWWWKLALAAALVVALAWVAGALALPIHVEGWHLSLGALLYVNPLARSFEFVLGMSATLVFPRLEAAVARRAWLGSLLELAALACVFVATTNAAPLAHSAAGAFFGRPLAIWMVHGGIACVPFAIAVVVFACRAGLVSRLLSLPVLQTLGEISFSIYLLHQILIRWYKPRAASFADIPQPLQLAVFVAILLTLAHFVWSAVERPLRDWIAGRGRPRGAFASWRARGELAFVVALAAGVWALSERPPTAVHLAAQELERRRAATEPDALDARFGDARVLRAAVVEADERAVHAELVWEIVGDAPEPVHVAVHLVDYEGTILGQADYRQGAPEAGGTLVDVREIPMPRHGPRQLGIAVMDQSGRVLLVDRGNRDRNGTRLLVPVLDTPAPMPEKTASRESR